MPRTHNIDGVSTNFTEAEETARDAEEAAFETAKPHKAAKGEINRLETQMTPRRLREHMAGTETPVNWWSDQTALINAERNKL